MKTMSCLQRFLPPSKKLERIFTDNSKEFTEACQDSQWNRDTSTPHRSEKNGVAERAVRRVKEGTAIALCRADYQKNGGTVRCIAFVTCATCMIKWTMARQHSRRDMARHLTESQSLVEHWLSTSQLPRRGKCRVQQFGKKALKGIFLGSVLRAGRRVGQETWWWQTLGFARIRRLRIVRQNIQKPRSVRQGRIPTSVRKRKSKHSWPSQTVFDSSGEPRARRWCWNWRRRQKKKKHRRFVVYEWRIYRHHEEPRLKFFDPDNGTFPIPLWNVGVMRQTQTSINNFSEHGMNCLWTEAKGVTLSEEWTGTTRFQILRTRLPEGYKWVNGKTYEHQ